MLVPVTGAYGDMSHTDSAQALATVQTHTLNPVADAEVRSDTPTANNGAGTRIYTDGMPFRNSYLRFSVPAGGTPTKATLRIFATSSQSLGFDVHGVSDNSWQETAITYQSAPAMGPTSGSSGAVLMNTWKDVDVTSLVTASGAVSFGLTTLSTTNLALASRESGPTTAPQLIVETTDSTPTGTPPSNTSAPTISGSPEVGQTLTADPGTWSGDTPISYAYQWRRCDTGGLNCGDTAAIGQTYTLATADAGSTMRVVVTASNAAGQSTTESAATATVTEPPPPPPPPSGTATFTPEADSTVESSKPSTNFGTAQKLRVDGSPLVLSYLRFAVQGLSGTVSRATLRINAASSQSTGFDVHAVADNTWGEKTITYSNRPAFEPGTVGSSGPLTNGSRASVDVTSLIDGNGARSIAIETLATTAASLASRETATPPELVVETVDESEPTAPASVSPPTISGTPEVGKTLTADPGTWSGTTPISFAYQWRRCDAGGCTDIATGGTQSYIPESADVGFAMRVTVTATNDVGQATAESAPTAMVAEPPPAGADPVIAAAGDIACDPADANYNAGIGSDDSCHQKTTSDLMVGANLAAVLPLGDNQYECGGLNALYQSYDSTWGRLKSISHPVIGNHDYTAPTGTDCDPAGNGAGHWQYWGSTAGDPSKGYYSYDIGSWHLIALNSQCNKVVGGGCVSGSEQEQWLRADLAAHPNACTLAYMHHPRWSSAEKTSDPRFDALWRALVAGGAELLLVGHAHQYQRFAPMNANGAADTNGVREFVVGTGGKHIHVGDIFNEPNIEVVNDKTFGVLMLTLHPTSYDFRFAPEAGATFTDSGSKGCH